MKEFLQRAKLLFAEARLLKNFSEGSRRQGARMHGYVSLSSVRMTKNFMATALPYVNKPAAEQFGENLTGGVRHLIFRLERSKTLLPQERSRPARAFPRSMPRSIPARQRGLLRRLGHEWSNRGLVYGRSSNPETQVR